MFTRALNVPVMDTLDVHAGARGARFMHACL